MSDVPDSVTDPRPQPPLAPEDGDCCNSGCPLCIYDLYAEELARYRQALSEWNQRHGQQAP